MISSKSACTQLKSRTEQGVEYSRDIAVGFSFQELQLLHTLLFALLLLLS